MTDSIYVIHASKPYLHAKHYIGWTSRPVIVRLREHRNGRASPLTKAMVANGAELIVGNVIVGTRGDERKMKKRGSRAYCPICIRNKGNGMGEYLSVKRRKTRGNCKWCGNTKRTMYEYDHQGPFCNKSCATSHWMTWPYSAFGPLPVEIVA